MVLNLVTAIGAVGGGVVSGDTSGMVSAGKAAKVEVENNSVSEAADYLATGKKPEDRYKDALQQLKDAVDEFKAKNCAGISAAACGAKMDAHRDELLAGAMEFGSDFVPVYSDIKSFAEAQSAYDYLIAVIGVFPPAKGAKTLLNGVEAALKKGDVAEASKLLNKASDEIAAISGSKGSWSKELNNPKPNTFTKLMTIKYLRLTLKDGQLVLRVRYLGLKVIEIPINNVRQVNVESKVMRVVI